MKTLNLILADDHPVYRQGLRTILDQADDLKIVAEASDGEEALRLVRERKPDLLLLDVTMPKLDGIDVARACREEQLECGLIFLTMHQEPQLLEMALTLGVRGYVLKECLADDILDAVRTVARGEEYLSPALAQVMMKRVRSRIELRQANPGINDLTAAERRILKRIARNQTSKEIAQELGISIRTVENHRSRAARKLGLSGAHSLVKFAFDHREKL